MINVWNMYHGHIAVYMFGGGAEMRSKVDRLTCTDACTLCNKKMAPEEE